MNSSETDIIISHSIFPFSIILISKSSYVTFLPFEASKEFLFHTLLLGFQSLSGQRISQGQNKIKNRHKSKSLLNFCRNPHQSETLPFSHLIQSIFSERQIIESQSN